MSENEDSDKYVDALEKTMVDKRRHRVKRKEDREAVASVLDSRTLMTLNEFLNKGKIKNLIGTISAGKEANVYLGIYQDGAEVAIKVYKIDNQSAKWMQEYMRGDPRFRKMGTNVTSPSSNKAGKIRTIEK